MKRNLLLMLILAALLLLLGCTSEEAVPTTGTTVASPASTSAPTTAASTSTSTTSTTASTIATLPTTFTAELSGAEVVPAVETSATGSATFTFDASGLRAHFVLELSNISGVIASRVHEGEPGTNGRGVLILYPGPDKLGVFTGTLAEGNFNASALIGSLTGKTVADLAALFASGRAYVNVGTIKNRDGEIRGQLH